MPSPKELAEVRARIRELITEFTQQDMPSDELGERLHRLGVQNGRPVLNMLVTMAVNGMRQLQRTVPGAQLGGIARHLQDSVSVHGEPYSSMVYGLTEAMRLGVQRAPEGAQQAINEVWRSWGPDAVEIGVTIVVILYGEIAKARGIGIAQAWAEAAERDVREIETHLATPLAIAEQRVWDTGFTDAEYRTLMTRIQSVLIGAEAFGKDSVGLGDLARTRDRKEAIVGLMQAIKDERGRRGGEEPPAET